MVTARYRGLQPSSGWKGGLRPRAVEELAQKPAGREDADGGEHPGAELPAAGLLDRGAEAGRVRLDLPLTGPAHSQRPAIGAGRETADAVQVGRVVERLGFDEEAEFLSGFEICPAKLTSTGGHGFLIVQKVDRRGALGFGKVNRRVERSPVS